MPRYEFKDGSSNKFWQITLENSNLTVTYGKIGTQGQKKQSSFGSPALAQKEYDKLLREKLGKGYVCVDGTEEELAQVVQKKTVTKKVKEPAASAKERNEQLEQTILEATTSKAQKEALLVYADWLLSSGNEDNVLWGEWIQLSVALSQGEKSKDKIAREKALGEQVKARFLPLANKNEKQFLMTYEHGVPVSLYMKQFADDESHYDSTTPVPPPKTLSEIFHSRFCFALRELTYGFVYEEYRSSFDAYGRCWRDAYLPGLRTVRFGAIDRDQMQVSDVDIGHIDGIWKAAPNVESVWIRSGVNVKLGDIQAPNLKRLVIMTGALSKENASSIAKGNFPKIEHLEVYFGKEYYCYGKPKATIKSIEPLLSRKDLANLRHLALKNSEFADQIPAAIVKCVYLTQLKSLDLSMGVMTDAGAQVLLKHAELFQHLQSIDLDRNFIEDKKIQNQLATLCNEVKIGTQQVPDNWDGKQHRYVSLGE